MNVARFGSASRRQYMFVLSPRGQVELAAEGREDAGSLRGGDDILSRVPLTGG